MIFARANGEISERADYLVIKTPSNPGFHWGNYLVFARPPQAGDAELWPALFRKEFADLPGIQHMAMTWDEPVTSDFIQPFLDLGFTFESNIALATTSVHRPAKFNTVVTVRQIESDQEWETVVQGQLLANEKYEAKGFETFKRTQMANYRRMTDAGRGHWFGAFLEGQLAANLGVFFEGDVGRFQAVVTHPDYRRRGICGRLVYEAALVAFEKFRVVTLVMVADEGYHAAGIYESVGFSPAQSNYTLARWPKTTVKRLP